jgi:glycosyltransferase involved in cell wall biosynthesis
MNIGYVVEHPTQFEVPFYRFAAADEEHDLTVFYPRPPEDAPRSDDELGRSVSWGFDLSEGYPWHVADPSDRAALSRQLESAGLDLLIVNGYTLPFYRRATRAARKLGLPLALRLDSVLFNHTLPRKWAKRGLFLWLRRRYQHFLATGSLTREFLAAVGVPEERVGAFPYAVDVEHFRRGADLTAAEARAVRVRWGLPEDIPLVLSLTKFSARESPHDLLRAAARLVEKGSEAVFVLAGAGPEEDELRREAEELLGEAAAERVIFPGYVPYTDLPALYGTVDLFVHPVPEERWGVSVAEALAAGLPVVTSDRVGAAHDLIRTARNGFTYPAGAAQELAWAIDQALGWDRAEVAAVDREILARWDYAATWKHLLDAARATRKGST